MYVGSILKRSENPHYLNSKGFLFFPESTRLIAVFTCRLHFSRHTTVNNIRGDWKRSAKGQARAIGVYVSLYGRVWSAHFHVCTRRQRRRTMDQVKKNAMTKYLYWHTLVPHPLPGTTPSGNRDENVFLKQKRIYLFRNNVPNTYG